MDTGAEMKNPPDSDQSLDPEKPDAQIMTVLRPLVLDLHLASRGLITSWVPVLSDLMRHPVPPHVARRILKPQDDSFGLPAQDVVTEQECLSAIEASIGVGDTVQMYADVIYQHTLRLRKAKDIYDNLEVKLLNFYSIVECDLSRVGLLLSDLAPEPHTGATITTDMARSLLQCHSCLRCSFQSFLLCLQRFTNLNDEEERLADIVLKHTSQDPPGSTSVTPIVLTPSSPSDTFRSGPLCMPWKETLREWLMEKQAFEAISHAEQYWEDPDSTNPRRSWAALIDLFMHFKATSLPGSERWSATACMCLLRTARIS